MGTLISSERAPWLSIVMSLAGIVLFWQLVISVTGVPAFIFPAPLDVLTTFTGQFSLLFQHALITATEIIAGLLLGSFLGIATAIGLTLFQSARRWALPLMVISQSLPVFAIAPLLTLWFGYGMGSKIVMATMIIYFPVTAATFDGLRLTSTSMIDLARTMKGSTLAIMLHIRLPAALPSISSGIRVAASIAPIGAVVGEWVGSSHGLGFLMLQANSRMQTDLMFAALFCLCLMAYGLYCLVSQLLDRALYWQQDSALIPNHTFSSPTRK